MMKLIGILAIQGAFIEHYNMLLTIPGVIPKLVKSVTDFDDLDGLVIPGGESTVMSKFIVEWGLFDTMKTFIKTLKPVFGTCAGAILLSKTGIFGGTVTVQRNAYGSQQFSFVAPLTGLAFPFEGVFIRAPKIIDLSCEASVVLAKHNEQPVLVQSGNRLLCTFHPELTSDNRIHQQWINTF